MTALTDNDNDNNGRSWRSWWLWSQLHSAPYRMVYMYVRRKSLNGQSTDVTVTIPRSARARVVVCLDRRWRESLITGNVTRELLGSRSLSLSLCRSRSRRTSTTTTTTSVERGPRGLSLSLPSQEIPDLDSYSELYICLFVVCVCIYVWAREAAW